MSIFFIFIIASVARLAFALSCISSMTRLGTTCHGKPNLPLSQPDARSAKNWGQSRIAAPQLTDKDQRVSLLKAIF
jgi:hypothetical protein